VPRPVAHLELAIDVDSDPISGLVSNGTGRARPFSGWIDLVAAIEEARLAQPSESVSAAPPRPGSKD
jgi:hypothetical protein